MESGADAVYLGGGHFNARRSAANFGPPELAAAVLYAHRHGVRVYVTVNILVAQGELSELAAFLQTVHAAGADAVIVQDPGAALLVRELFPGLSLHASTQMTVHSTSAARFWREAGFERIVLARELSLAEITRIRREAGVEVEVFAHGALCVGYSGQCLFSSLIGGRSGNRGMCAQPCRLPYRLVGPDKEFLPVDGPYLLSTRDLNLSECLPDLAGVDGLKIEGRLRRPAYVATVVRVYRHLLDRLARGETGPVPPEAARELAQVFNRDFTTGYLYGPPGPDLMSRQRPNNRGLPAGRVVQYDRQLKRARLHLTAPVGRGDVLAVWVSRGGRVVVPVEEMLSAGQPVEEAPAGAEVELAVAAPVRPGDRVFKTLDAALTARATVAAAEEIPLAMTVEVSPGRPVRLVVTDPAGHRGEAESEVAAVPATTHPLTEEVLRRQLGRLGNTEYRLASLAVQGPPGLMLPLSQLNVLRRAALADLERRAFGRRPSVAYEEGLARLLSGDGHRGREGKSLPALAVAVTGLPALEAALDGGASLVYLADELGEPLQRAGLAQALDLCRRHGARLVPATPVIAHDGEYAHLEELLTACRELGLDTILAGNAGPLALARNYGLSVWADFTLPAFNSLALVFWRNSGVTGVTLSPELTLGQVRELARLSPLPLEGLVHGVLRLMVSAHCPLGAAMGAGSRKTCPGRCREGSWWLKDRRDELFGMVTDRGCRMHLFNGRDLSMYTHLAELLPASLRLWRIEARARDARYVAAVTAVYRAALDRLAAGRDPVRPEDQATLAGFSPAGLTGAHYFRGVR